MKCALILFAFVLTRVMGLAQDSVHVQQRELDSLSQLIQRHSAKDSALVKQLNEYAQRCFYNLDFINGLKAAGEARALSKQLNFKKGEGLYFKSMAIFHRNHYSRLAMYYQVQSNRILHEPTHFGPFTDVVIQRGIRDGELKTIITNLQLTLTHFELNNDKEALAQIHYALAAAEGARFGNNKEKSNEHRNKALKLFRNLNHSYPVLVILTRKMVDLWIQENEADAKKLELEAANIFLTEQDKQIKALDALFLGITYGEHNRVYLALEYLFNAEEILKESGRDDLLRSVYWSIPFAYFMSGKIEKSLEYANKGLDLYNKIEYYEGVEYLYLIVAQDLINLNRIEEINPALWDRVIGSASGRSNWFDAGRMRTKAEMLRIQNKPEQAIQVLMESLKAETARENTRGASNAASQIAQYNREIGKLERAIEYGLLAYDLASKTSFLQQQITSTELLSQCYEESGKKDKAFEYLKLNRSVNEKSERLNNAARISELEIQAVLKKSQREIELLEKETQLKEQENRTQRLWIFSISGALLSAILIAFILVRNNKQKQKANTVLETTLSNLKSTQSQLIQSEKMASLGELTAGIAHEIQNPLNFVNNFSEVNKELIDELEHEADAGNFQEVKAIAKSLKDNEEKIVYHGQRADAIVKGMMQHSRSTSAVKEPTNVNALADEYLRLVYHGLRAKDKTFKATVKTEFDPTIGPVNLVPQDIGRVILNLINNAFYAVNEKKKESGAEYEPMVSVNTKKSGDKVLISVRDNGNGIPKKVLDKIFQPFFTTKPAGQGTGLGLSLSYDIVKAHGGEIKIETKEGEGSEFSIYIPVV